jgi:ferredoxin, 2Fe-2S
VAIEHACEKVGACATCHVHVRAGTENLTPAENAKLDTLIGIGSKSRLSCQMTRLGTEPVTVELLGALG